VPVMDCFVAALLAMTRAEHFFRVFGVFRGQSSVPYP
jgi:hypothetical protein